MRIALCALSLMVCAFGVAPVLHQALPLDLCGPADAISSPAAHTDLQRFA